MRTPPALLLAVHVWTPPYVVEGGPVGLPQDDMPRSRWSMIPGHGVGLRPYSSVFPSSTPNLVKMARQESMLAMS